MRRSAAGFTLVEFLVALTLMAIGLLAVVPMFVQAMASNATSGDFGRVGALAVGRMEQLRSTPFNTLSVGGSLTTDATGYFVYPEPEIVVRWQIVDNGGTVAGTKITTVRAIALSNLTGPRREATLSTIRGN